MKKVLFPHISWLLLLLIPFVIIGFYPSYFSRLSANQSIFHVHAAFMLCWVALAIGQPFLIHLKKTRLHKLFGKVSYVIMPLVFLTAFLVVRHIYYATIEDLSSKASSGVIKMSSAEIQKGAAGRTMIGSLYLCWLIIFYILAVIHRKKILYHATYMFAAILTLLGPSVDRLIYNTVDQLGWEHNFFIQDNFVFAFNVVLLSSLLIYQWRKGNSIKPAAIALGIYLVGLALFFSLPKTNLWNSFVAMIM